MKSISETIVDDVWCGENVTILKGVAIGQDHVPIKQIKERFTEEKINERERLLYAK